jgi:hypothetical protein
MKTVQEFYDFFAAIPANKWCRFSFTNGDSHCAQGHLREWSLSKWMRQTDVAFDNIQSTSLLESIFRRAGLPILTDINDAPFPSTPRQNILDALQVCAELGVTE